MLKQQTIAPGNTMGAPYVNHVCLRAHVIWSEAARVLKQYFLFCCCWICAERWILRTSTAYYLWDGVFIIWFVRKCEFTSKGLRSLNQKCAVQAERVGLFELKMAPSFLEHVGVGMYFYGFLIFTLHGFASQSLIRFPLNWTLHHFQDTAVWNFFWGNDNLPLLWTLCSGVAALHPLCDSICRIQTLNYSSAGPGESALTQAHSSLGQGVRANSEDTFNAGLGVLKPQWPSYVWINCSNKCFWTYSTAIFVLRYSNAVGIDWHLISVSNTLSIFYWPC